MSKESPSEAAGRLIRHAMDKCRERVHDIHGVVTHFYSRSRNHISNLDIVSKAVEEAGLKHEDIIDSEVQAQHHLMTDLSRELSRTSEVAESAVGESTELQQVSQFLETIALESRLLSVNAKVQAANLSTDGRAIQVIATAIRDLSNSLDTCAEELETRVALIQRVLPGLAQQSEMVSNTTTNLTTNLKTMLSHLQDNYQSYADSIEEHLHSSRRQALDTSDDAHEILSSTQGFDEILQMLNAALIHLGTGQEDPMVGTPERFTKESPDLESNDSDNDLMFL